MMGDTLSKVGKDQTSKKECVDGGGGGGWAQQQRARWWSTSGLAASATQAVPDNCGKQFSRARYLKGHCLVLIQY